jgi:hypothetical protein
VGTGNVLTLNNTIYTGGSISTGSIQDNNMVTATTGTGTTGVLNPFTYNGKLVEKPTSDFMPLTTDFSKFGR